MKLKFKLLLLYFRCCQVICQIETDNFSVYTQEVDTYYVIFPFPVSKAKKTELIRINYNSFMYYIELINNNYLHD